jgi:hypothetical protein
MRHLLLALLAVTPAAAADGGSAQWRSYHAGCGGRVQGISCDPTITGRLYWCSDMEGFYRSDDFGRSWIHMGTDLPVSWTLQVEGRGQNLWVGHGIGLSRSTDDGATWSSVPIAANHTIGMLEIDPNNSQRVYAGVNWLDHKGQIRYIDQDYPKRFPQYNIDERQIFYTLNNGATWQASSWAAGTGEPRAWSIQVDPTDTNRVLVATNDGLFHFNPSNASWTPIAPPAGVTGPCRGADVTPDGDWIYALYTVGTEPALFAQGPNGQWQNLGRGAIRADGKVWYPKVHPGSTATSHQILLGQYEQNPNVPLHEARVTIANGVATASIVKVFGYITNAPGITYDVGWNPYESNCRNYVYMPSTWQTPFTRGVFTQSQQSMFIGDAAKGNTDWIVISSYRAGNANSLPTYHHRGAASTFNYCSSKLGNYIIQGMADNTCLESYDNGASWRQLVNTGFPDIHMTHIVPGNPPIVLTSVGGDFGGGSEAANSAIWYKKLINGNHTDVWVKWIMPIDVDRKGVPRNRIHYMRNDPLVPNRVLALTHVGLYVCDDIRSCIETGTPTFRPIGPITTYKIKIDGVLTDVTGPSIERVHDLTFLPDHPGRVIMKDQKFMWWGEPDGAGGYTWSQITNGTGQPTKLQLGDVVVARRKNQDFVYTYEQFKGIVRMDIAAKRFTTLVLPEKDTAGKQNILNITGTPPWHVDGFHEYEILDMATDSNHLYAVYGMWEYTRKGLGVVRGVIADDGTVSNWENWTADAPYCYTRDIRIDDGMLWLSTQGAGLLGRYLDGRPADAVPTPPALAWPGTQVLRSVSPAPATTVTTPTTVTFGGLNGKQAQTVSAAPSGGG